MRAFYFAELAGLPVSKQLEMASDAGMDSTSPTWTDTRMSFPEQRDRMLKFLRPGGDEVWVSSLPAIAANRHDLRHVINVLTKVGANIVEGATGWTLRAPFEEGLSFANCSDYWAKRRKLLDDPRGNGRATRKAARGIRMPVAEARTIWLDPTLIDGKTALAKINADDRYKLKWSYSSACHTLGPTKRPPGARPKPAQPETDE